MNVNKSGKRQPLFLILKYVIVQWNTHLCEVLADSFISLKKDGLLCNICWRRQRKLKIIANARRLLLVLMRKHFGVERILVSLSRI
jgi:hypothetical protein